MIDKEFIERCKKKEEKNLRQFMYVLNYFTQKNIEFIEKRVPKYPIKYLQHNYGKEMSEIQNLINSFTFEE